jgi:hypothetical protein
MPVRHCQFPGLRWGRTIVLLLALLPACCAAPQPTPPPAEPAPEQQPAPPAQAARPILRAAWSFRTGSDAYAATARAGPTSLQVVVRREGLIRLTMSLSRDAPPAPVAHFSGPAGRWLVPGRQAGRRVVLFTLGRNETSLSRILMLLSGGALNREPPGEDLPILSLPEPGAEGQQWFACVRSIVTWT